jgi:hypothetical protein
VQLAATQSAATTKAEQALLEDGQKKVSLYTQMAKIRDALGDANANKAGLNAATGAIKGPWGSILTGAGAGLGTGGAGGLLVGNVPGMIVGGVGGGIVGAAGGYAYGNTARQDFENDIKLIYSAQALTEIGNLGYSLAPITEKELEIVGNMASNLNSSVRIAEDGTISIKGSTKEFEKNMSALDAQMTKAMQQLEQDPTVALYLTHNDAAEIDAVVNATKQNSW